jgi:hypothetical protein
MLHHPTGRSHPEDRANLLVRKATELDPGRGRFVDAPESHREKASAPAGRRLSSDPQRRGDFPVLGTFRGRKDHPGTHTSHVTWIAEARPPLEVGPLFRTQYDPRSDAHVPAHTLRRLEGSNPRPTPYVAV